MPIPNGKMLLHNHSEVSVMGADSKSCPATGLLKNSFCSFVLHCTLLNSCGLSVHEWLIINSCGRCATELSTTFHFAAKATAGFKFLFYMIVAQL